MVEVPGSGIPATSSTERKLDSFQAQAHGSSVQGPRELLSRALSRGGQDGSTTAWDSAMPWTAWVADRMAGIAPRAPHPRLTPIMDLPEENFREQWRSKEFSVQQ
jgi:hypothetical protein